MTCDTCSKPGTLRLYSEQPVLCDACHGPYRAGWLAKERYLLALLAEAARKEAA